MKILCPICKRNADEIIESPYHTGRMNPSTGSEIIIDEARAYECSHCHMQWLTAAQEAQIEKEILKKIYSPLSSDEIGRIRHALPINSKKGLANFLCLNDKAFVHWEGGKSAPNPAYDLLLRLIAHSKENYEFVESLHKKGFRFDPSDYYFLRETFEKKCN